MRQQDLLRQLQENRGMLQQLLSSPDTRRLMELLSREQGGQAVKSAADAAAKGDAQQLSAMVNALMKSSEGAAIIRRLSRSAEQ